MEILRDIAGATMVAFLIVAIFKTIFAGASGRIIGLFAVAAGQFAAISMVGLRGELAWAQSIIFQVVVTGIVATASAMGIRYADSKADEGRTNKAPELDKFFMALDRVSQKVNEGAATGLRNEKLGEEVKSEQVAVAGNLAAAHLEAEQHMGEPGRAADVAVQPTDEERQK